MFVSQFPHSCICDRFIYAHDWSAYFAAAKLTDWSLKKHKLLTDIWMWKLGMRPQFHFWEYYNRIFDKVQAIFVSPDATLELETDVDPGFRDRIPPPAWSAKLTAKLKTLQMFSPVCARQEVCKNFNKRKCQMFANSTCTDLRSSQSFFFVK